MVNKRCSVWSERWGSDG